MNENLYSGVLVSVKNKLVIPRDVRQAIGVEVGDLREAKAEAGKITLTSKSVSAGVAESVANFVAGRSFGPFASKELVNSLHGKSAELRVKARRKRK